MSNLIEKIDKNNIPKHIGIIMDGNGRWAKKRLLPRQMGHKKGAENFEKIARFADSIGIKYVTFYAFSTENWKRPKKEVDALMNLFYDYLVKVENEYKNDYKMTFIGDRSVLNSKLTEKMNYVEKLTQNNDKITLCIAINYGGQSEIVNATKNIALDVLNKKLDIDNLDESIFENYLYTASMPSPELIIRPSGEYRLSNFLTWQSAYSEFWYSNVLWPDFKEEDLVKAIYDYQKRNRRFGGV